MRATSILLAAAHVAHAQSGPGGTFVTASADTFSAGVCLPAGADTCCSVVPFGPGSGPWYGICGYSTENAGSAPTAHPTLDGIIGVFSIASGDLPASPPGSTLLVDLVAFQSGATVCQPGDADYAACTAGCAATKAWGLSTPGSQVVAIGSNAPISAPGSAGMVLKAGCPYVSTPTTGASGDPHFHLAHGGRTDIRGEPGSVYSFLSAKNVNMNVAIAGADFAWQKRLIHGTKMSAAFWTVRTNETSAILTTQFVEGGNAATGAKNHAVVNVTSGGTGSSRSFKVDATHPLHYENVRVAVGARNMTVSVLDKWEMSATLNPFPFAASLNKDKNLVNVKVRALYDADHDIVAPHGLFGQSYDGDDMAVDGRVDSRSEHESTTAAQGEGAIEGTISDYKMASNVSTNFKFSRFDAKWPTRPRDVSKLSGKKHHVATKPAAGFATDVLE